VNHKDTYSKQCQNNVLYLRIYEQKHLDSLLVFR